MNRVFSTTIIPFTPPSTPKKEPISPKAPGAPIRPGPRARDRRGWAQPRMLDFDDEERASIDITQSED